MKALTTMLLAATILLLPATNTASAQLDAGCMEDSPERQGGIGCTIIEKKRLPKNLKEPLFWVVERFDSAERARAAAGPASVALEAHGLWWLLTVEPHVSAHPGSRHVATIGPLPLPPATQYSLQVMSATFAPGMTTRVHHHSGAEAWYVVGGEQCLETPTRAYKTHAGENLVIPAGVTMRLMATGSTLRRALAIIVYDSAQPPTTRMEDAPPLVTCK